MPEGAVLSRTTIGWQLRPSTSLARSRRCATPGVHGFSGPSEATPHCLIDLSHVIVVPPLVLHWTLSTFSTNEPGGRLQSYRNGIIIWWHVHLEGSRREVAVRRLPTLVVAGFGSWPDPARPHAKVFIFSSALSVAVTPL